MNSSVYQYASAEVEAALGVLNTAIKNHREWFDNLHTSILCEQPFADDILDEESHKKCEFSKWYYGDVCDSIRTIKEFSKLETIHTHMHSHARNLALIVQQKKKIQLDEYQAFLNNQHELIDLLTHLRDKLIEHEHCFDAVTGAVNRRSINLLLEQLFENAQRYNAPYSLAMLDVDHFKKVNDQHGHIAGDSILKNICIYLRESLRKSDCIGRYGGEEFLILLPETSQIEAADIMDKCRTGISSMHLSIRDISVNVSVSTGISEVSNNDEDAWQAVKRADDALYQAKQSGRNCVKQL